MMNNIGKDLIDRKNKWKLAHHYYGPTKKEWIMIGFTIFLAIIVASACWVFAPNSLIFVVPFLILWPIAIGFAYLINYIFTGFDGIIGGATFFGIIFGISGMITTALFLLI
jgi:hypothetical protein